MKVVQISFLIPGRESAVRTTAEAIVRQIEAEHPTVRAAGVDAVFKERKIVGGRRS